jgi:outer membrane lipoprotein SlyB
MSIREHIKNNQKEDIMETTSKSRIHPLIAGAAAAVILVSLVGVAAITGLIPGSHSANAPLVASAPPTAAEKAAAERDATKTERAEHAAEAQAVSHRRPGGNVDRAQNNPPQQVASVCESCGRVESIREIKTAAKPSGIGIAAGAVLGGVLGNQVGAGNGRALATVAGAVGDGFAGNEVEKRTHTTTTYEVVVRMENGSVRQFPQSSSNGWQVGDPVRVVNGELRSRG